MNSERRFFVKSLVVVAALSVMSSVLPVRQLGASEDIDRFEWKGPIGRSEALRIENPFGDVRLRYGGDAGEIEVLSVMQQLRPDGIRLETRVIEGDDGLTIDVGWAEKPGVENPPRPAGDRSRADLAVLVPRGASVEVDAPSGLIETRGVHGDVVLRSDTGEIRIHRHFGAVSASTGSGPISAVLLTGQTGEAQRFSSRTGPIEIWVSADAKLNTVLKTSEAITTDFSIDIEHRDGEEPDTIGRAVLGGGGPELRIESLRGDVALRRVELPQESAE